MDTLEQVAGKNIADSLSDILKDNHTPKLITVGKTPKGDDIKALQAPKNVELKSVKSLVDEYAIQPVRRRGTHIVTSLDSFIDLTNRFKDADSVIFADSNIQNPGLTAVLNFHIHGGDLDSPEDNLARYGDHKVDYKLALSKEWQAWKAKDAQVMSQGDFAAFIEDRISDVLMPDPGMVGDISDAATGGDFGDRSPVEQLAYLAKLLGGSFATPSKLLELSRGLAVRDNLAVKEAANLQTGEGKIQWQSQHTDEDGVPLIIPNLFLIAIPIFENTGVNWRMAVRLRYRLVSGKIIWFYQIYRAELIFDAAIKGASEKAQVATELPLFLGKPASA